MTERYIDPYLDAEFLGLTMAEFAELLKSLEQRRTATKMMADLISRGMHTAKSDKEREAGRLKMLEAEVDHAMAASASVQMALVLQATEDRLAAEGRLDPESRITPKAGEPDRILDKDAESMRQRALEAAEAYDNAMDDNNEEAETAAVPEAKPEGLAGMEPKGRC